MSENSFRPWANFAENCRRHWDICSAGYPTQSWATHSAQAANIIRHYFLTTLQNNKHQIIPLFVRGCQIIIRKTAAVRDAQPPLCVRACWGTVCLDVHPSTPPGSPYFQSLTIALGGAFNHRAPRRQRERGRSTGFCTKKGSLAVFCCLIRWMRQ